jgi:hypothetical protein
MSDCDPGNMATNRDPDVDAWLLRAAARLVVPSPGLDATLASLLPNRSKPSPLVGELSHILCRSRFEALTREADRNATTIILRRTLPRATHEIAVLLLTAAVVAAAVRIGKGTGLGGGLVYVRVAHCSLLLKQDSPELPLLASGFLHSLLEYERVPVALHFAMAMIWLRLGREAGMGFQKEARAEIGRIGNVPQVVDLFNPRRTSDAAALLCEFALRSELEHDLGSIVAWIEREMAAPRSWPPGI